jgi:5-hydroxyisourate hydrolase-like protein (transthyretin family)
MDSLTIIYEKLKVGIGSKKDRYFIPEVWNTWGYEVYQGYLQRGRDHCRPF